MTNRIHAYCINLDREPEKFLKIKEEFDKYFEIERVSAIDATINNITGIEALFKTNIQLFKKIIEHKEEEDNSYVIIIEDDIYKYPEFDEYLPKIQEFINNKENDDKWDFISLDNFLNFEKPKIDLFNEFLYKINKSRMAGFMIYNIHFLEKNIDYLSECEILDMSMKQNPDFIQLIPKKVLIKQIVDKISGTCLINTKHYEDYYNETEKYMKEYFSNKYKETELNNNNNIDIQKRINNNIKNDIDIQKRINKKF
jgi:GR25 family glycosyltransferase involved in LPS biosynthesis